MGLQMDFGTAFLVTPSRLIQTLFACSPLHHVIVMLPLSVAGQSVQVYCNRYLGPHAGSLFHVLRMCLQVPADDAAGAKAADHAVGACAQSEEAVELVVAGVCHGEDAHMCTPPRILSTWELLCWKPGCEGTPEVRRLTRPLQIGR